MAKQHGKKTIIKVAATDISTYTNASELTINGDAHDTTTYGNDWRRKDGGLIDGKFKCSGFYDSTAVSGPRALLLPKVATTVAVIRQPEGAGTGKPQDAFSAVMTSYVESSPVADMVTWSAEFELDGPNVATAQA